MVTAWFPFCRMHSMYDLYISVLHWPFWRKRSKPVQFGPVSINCIYSTIMNLLVSSFPLSIFSFAWYRYALIRACCWTLWFVTYSTRQERDLFFMLFASLTHAASMSGLFERSIHAEGACHQLLTQIHFYKIWRKIRNLDITETGRVHVMIHVYVREKRKVGIMFEIISMLLTLLNLTVCVCVPVSIRN